MSRYALLLACLVTITACDSTITNPNRPAYAGPSVDSRHGIRGVLRHVVEDPQYEWQLELPSGAMLRLVGGPLEMYVGLEDKEVFIVGTYGDDGGINVETVEEDTQIFLEFNRRPAKK